MDEGAVEEVHAVGWADVSTPRKQVLHLLARRAAYALGSVPR